MTTARDLIARAQRLLGAVPHGDALGEVTFQDSLISLNSMVSSWNLERLNIYAYKDLSAVVSGNEVTLGGTAPDIAERPLSIENLYARVEGLDYQIELVDQVRWYAIMDKTVTGDIPRMAYYEPSYDQGVLHLWPTISACEIHVVMWSPVPSFPDLTTQVKIPDGYDRPIVYNLAIEVSPEYQLQPSPSVQQIAVESLASVKRINQRPIVSYTELPWLIGRESWGTV